MGSSSQKYANIAASLYEIQATDIDGNLRSMSEFAGKTLLIVNVASK
jgi:glutathione peroxidase-family protein